MILTPLFLNHYNSAKFCENSVDFFVGSREVVVWACLDGGTSTRAQGFVRQGPAMPTSLFDLAEAVARLVDALDRRRPDQINIV